MNGIGSKVGTALANAPDYLPGMGIYLDNNSTGVEIRDNTIANMPLHGIFYHGGQDIVLQNNTSFNNKNQLGIADPGHDLIRNNSFGNNIFFAKQPEQTVTNLFSVRDDFGLWGAFNGNYYCRPLAERMPIVSNYSYNNYSRTKVDAYDVEGWMSKYQFDWNSQQTPVQFPAYSVNYSDGVNKYSNGAFNSNIGYPSNWSPVGNIRTTWSNSGRLNDGNLQVSFPNSINYGDPALMALSVGSVNSGKKYLLKFSLVGSVNNKSIGIHLRNADNQSSLSRTEFVKLSPARSENELLFSVNSSVNSADLVFEVNDQCGTFWLDNVQLTEVDATPTNPDDYIRFEYNPTSSRTTVALDGDYIDVRNKKYNGNVNLEPYSSVILLRDPNGNRGNVNGNGGNGGNGGNSDNTPPSIVARNITVQADASGRASINPGDVIASITDNSAVDNSSITVSQTQFNCSNVSSEGGGSSASGHQAFTATTSTGVQSFGGSLGMVFKVNSPQGIIVNQLGAFDHQANGITGTEDGGIRVAIFSRATKTAVPGLNALIVGTADGLDGNHRMKMISPVTLGPGEYMVVAMGYNQNELNGNSKLGSSIPFGDNGGGAISYGSNGFYDNVSNGFAYPTLEDPSLGYLAGTFSYITAGSSNNTNGVAHQAYTATTTTGVQNFGGELGMLFNVNNPNGIVISELGAFDHQGNGISGTQSGGIRVAIFDQSTRQIVPGLDAIVVGNADGINGNHRMKKISPVTLMPGRYIVVAKGYNQNELAGNSSMGSPIAFGDIANGAISYDLSQVLYGTPGNGNNFNYPTNNGYGPGYLAGTFTYAVAGSGTAPSNSGSHQAYTANTSNGAQSYGGSLGMVFKVNNPSGIVVNQLGAFDHQGNGITGTQNGGVRVAIFSRTTKVQVPGLDAFIVGNADGINGNHRMKNISPVTLPPGEYVVVAMGYNQNELNGNSKFGSTIPFGDNGGGAISYGTNGFYANVANGFAYRTLEDDGLGYLAGTFSYTTTNSGGGSTGGTNVNTVTISASDVHGNTAQTTATVTVVCNQGQNQRLAFTDAASSTNALISDESAINGKANALAVFPSPTTGRFTLQLSKLSVPQVVVEILSESGTTVTRKKANTFSAANSIKMDFDLSSQPAGVYFIKAVGADGVKPAKW